MNAATFRTKAPALMKRFMADFSCTKEDAAAVFGNAGHESGGFLLMQEIKPTVPGSRGGFGWFQWTGPRRRKFEAFCEAKGLLPTSDEANYGYLCHELLRDERTALPRVKAAKSLRDKVIEFELGFERAGVKHYDSRVRWAETALDAFKVKYGNGLAPVKKPSTAGSVVAGGATVGGSVVAAHQAGLPPWAIAAIVAGVGLVAFLIWKSRK